MEIILSDYLGLCNGQSVRKVETIFILKLRQNHGGTPWEQMRCLKYIQHTSFSCENQPFICRNVRLSFSRFWQKMKNPRFFIYHVPSRNGKPLPDDAPPEQVASAVYEIRIRPGIHRVRHVIPSARSTVASPPNRAYTFLSTRLSSQILLVYTNPSNFLVSHSSSTW